jgi:hypothetical protein
MQRVSKAFVVAADIIEERKQTIALNVAQRLSLLEPYRVRGLRLPDLIGRIPRFIDIVVATLREGVVPERFAPEGVYGAMAVEHARLRYQQGLRSGHVTWEFHVLRREIWLLLYHELPPRYPEASVGDVFRLGEMLDDTLDPLIWNTVAYFGSLAVP